jgi:hypothetical protein
LLINIRTFFEQKFFFYNTTLPFNNFILLIYLKLRIVKIAFKCSKKLNASLYDHVKYHKSLKFYSFYSIAKKNEYKMSCYKQSLDNKRQYFHIFLEILSRNKIKRMMPSTKFKILARWPKNPIWFDLDFFYFLQIFCTKIHDYLVSGTPECIVLTLDLCKILLILFYCKKKI